MTLDKFGAHILNKYTRNSDFKINTKNLVKLVNISEANLFYTLVLPFSVKYQQDQIFSYKYPLETDIISFKINDSTNLKDMHCLIYVKCPVLIEN